MTSSLTTTNMTGRFHRDTWTRRLVWVLSIFTWPLTAVSRKSEIVLVWLVLTFTWYFQRLENFLDCNLRRPFFIIIDGYAICIWCIICYSYNHISYIIIMKWNEININKNRTNKQKYKYYLHSTTTTYHSFLSFVRKGLSSVYY